MSHSMKHKLFGVILFAVLMLQSICHAKPLYYPRPEADFDERTGYPLTLLRLVLDESGSGKQYELLPTDVRMPRGRSLKLLEQGIAVDIFWVINSKEREEALLPIPIPIYDGVFGYRLLLVNKENTGQFPKSISEAQLKQKVAGLGHDWPDFKILEKNGYTVQGSSSYNGLFRLLKLGRVDYLPRSVIEIWSEYDHFESQGLVVDQNVALFYPVDYYYFVNKNNVELADILYKGLKKLADKGALKSLFEAAYGDLIEQANLKERTIFRLENH